MSEDDQFLLIDSNRSSEKIQELREKLTSRVIGQDRAIRKLVDAFSVFLAGLQPKNRPIVTLLFLGPTGTGKTLAVRMLADALLGSPDAITRIDCAEFSRDHEVAKLIGSPPGYIGHRESEARLSQRNIDKFQTDSVKLNIILFDEIEKGSDDLFDILLGILDAGKLTLGNGDTTDFSRSIVVFTSNLGSRETHDMLSNSGIGFHAESQRREDLDETIYQKTKEVVQRFFRPEFLNRIDRLIVFRSLSRESVSRILDVELDRFQRRLLEADHPIKLTVTESAKKFLLREGYSDTFGARELSRAVEQFLVLPVANAINSGQITRGELKVVGNHKYLVLAVNKMDAPQKD